MIEYNLINILLKKDKYNLFFNTVLNNIQNAELKKILHALKVIHDSGSKEDYSLDDLELGFLTEYPSLKDSEKKIFELIFERIKKSEVDETLLESYLRKLKEKSLAHSIAVAALDVHEGRKDISSVIELTSQLGVDQPITDEIKFVTSDLNELYNSHSVKRGLRWRLTGLNQSLGSLRKGDFGFLFARPECLHPDTDVLLYSGKVVKAREVRPGMSLMGDDSTPRKVLATTYGTQPMYKITYPWGESYTVNENHILSLKRSKEECKHKYGEILNVTVTEYLSWTEGRKQRYKGWKTGVEFSQQSWHKLDPYYLGLWLGDGTAANQNITNADIEVSYWLEGYAQALGLTFKKTYRENQGKAFTLSFINSKGKPNKLLDLLREYKVLNNKHIPFEFKTASKESRKLLLSGLIDTDGYYDHKRNSYEIATVSRELADDILFVARSLGLHATKRERDNHYRIGIYGDLSTYPIQIPRKKYQAKEKTKRKGLQFGFTVEPLGEGEYYGFTLSGNHLFVLGDFTVTHNSGKTTFLASEVSYMAQQVPEDRPILWCNNEEQGEKVMRRIYSAALGRTEREIFADITRYQEAYNKRVGHKLVLLDEASLTKQYLDKVIKQVNPSLIIFDQIDKIKGFDADRNDLVLGKTYQWAREVAKTYCPVIAVCQADGAGEGVKWLTMGHVSDAKCLSPNTGVLMYDGTWKAVKDIKVDERVMGKDSLPRLVLSTARGTEEMFRVTHKIGGDYYDVNKSHILSLINQRGEKVNKNVLEYTKSDFGYRVPHELPEISLPIEPYYLGLWLGDGKASAPEITTMDIEIKNYVKEYSERLGCSYTEWLNGKTNPELVQAKIKYKQGIKHPLMEMLRKLDLECNKHIPEDYFRSSIKQRLDLIAGLIDSDGTLVKRKHEYYVVSNKNKNIAFGLKEIALSCGLMTTIKARKGYYYVSISGNDLSVIPTKVARKKSTYKSFKDVTKSRLLISPLGVGEYAGITIDGDHEFIIDGNIVTHNTSKQAEADWILGIGKSNDEGFEYIRYMNISKNKLSGDEDSIPSMRHGRFETLIRPDIARYEDINYE